MEKRRKIVVFGGTGYYGRKIVQHLLKKNQPVRVVSRNASKALQILGEDVEVIEGDVTDKDIIRKALEGADAVVVSLSAVSWKLIRKIKDIEYDAVLNILQTSKDLNIGRFVFVSVYEIRQETLQKHKIQELGEMKNEVEKKIRDSGLNWTILGCPPSQEIFFAFLRNGKLAVPGGGKNAIPSVSGEDVGEIAAQAIIRDDLSGKRFRLPGPEAYSFPEVAGLFTKKTGKTVKHVTIPLFMVNMVSLLLYPVNPFPRYLYKSLLLLNNFPKDLADKVTEHHQLLRKTFDYSPVTLEEEISKRLLSNKLKA